MIRGEKQSARIHCNGRCQGAVGIAVIGCGYWGPHLIRNLHGIADAELLGVADPRPDRLEYVRRSYPTVDLFSSHEELLATEADAVVVASPIHTHYRLAREALLAGKHVLVEKPLATSVAEAAELIELAHRRERVLMAGHTFVYNPAVRELRRLVQEGELGRIYYGDSARLNLGIFQRTVNVAWDLAPHDISILMHVLGQDPVMVSARGSRCVRPDMHDVCYLEIQFSAGTTANVHVSWLHPDKVRQLTLVGDRRMVVFDDVSSAAKLRIYDSGVQSPVTDNYGEFELAYRHGQIVIPYIDWREPLRLECEHFVHCVRSGERPLSDAEQGLAVVATLEAADRSLRRDGVRVPVERPPMPSSNGNRKWQPRTASLADDALAAVQPGSDGRHA
jgi:predicted dehydrogenase